MTKPVITAAHVTQQVSGLLTSSSSSLRQQHRQVRYADNTSRLKPRPTADTQTRKIIDCQTESGKHGADGQIKQEVDRFSCCQCCNSIGLQLLIFINPQYTVLHILSHCTSYSLFYFIICSYFHSHLYLYIYSLVLCFIVVLLFFVFFIYFIFLHFPLSGPVLTYISLLIIPCMIVYVTNNKEPWTLN